MVKVLKIVTIGLLTFPGGAKYEGMFKDNKKNGKGINLKHDRDILLL